MPIRSLRARDLIALLVVTILCCSLIAIAAETLPVAKISLLEGGAQARLGSTGEWKKVGQGDELTADYVVRTDKASKMELKLPDGSILRIAPSSRVRLKSLLHKGGRASNDISFKVSAGKVWANVSQALGSERKFEVSTGSAVAGVRGTIFRVDVAEDQATIVKVYSGAVAVSNAPIYQRSPKEQGKRRQVPGPRQVSKKEFEELVAKAMQEVRVAASGKMSMGDFDSKSAIDDWSRWNSERDKMAAIPH